MGFIGVFAYIIQMYIRPQDWVSWMYGFPVVVLIYVIFLPAAIFEMQKQKRPILLPQVYLLLCYLAMTFLSNVFTGNGSDATGQLVLYLKRSAIFFLLLFTVDDAKKLRKVVTLAVLMTTIVAVQSILQSKFGIMVSGQKFLQGTRVAWVGAWDGPNITCMLYVIGIALVLGFIMPGYSLGRKVASAVFIMIMTYSVYLTNSRGGFLSLLVVVFLFMWERFVKNKQFIVKVLSCAFIILVLVAGLKLGPSRMSELDSSESSAQERSWLWENAYDKFRENPVYGVGKGQYKVGIYGSAHNNFAQNMAEMGFVGLYIYIALMYLSAKGVLLVRRASLTGAANFRLLGNLSSAIFLSIIGFNVATFFITADLDILFVWIGLCACAVNIARKDIPGFSFKLTFKDVFMSGVMSIAMITLIYLIAVKEIF